MNDIYTILSKYFSGNADSDEVEKAEVFAKQNKKEFQVLQKIWASKADISIINRNTATAWQAFNERVNGEAKMVPMFIKIRRVAAVAAILFLTTLVWQQDIFNKSKWLVAEVTVNETDRMMTLEDGTIVYLNSGAKLSYPQIFQSNMREVMLSGEAYFDVAKNTDKPFIIKTSDSEIKVLGTSFNVSSTTEKTVVSVREGKVQVSSFLQDQKVILTEGFTAVNDQTGMIKQETDDLNFDSWKTGVFVFDSVPMQKVITSLNSYYGNQLELAPNVGIDCSLSFSIEKLLLEDVIEILQLTCKLQSKTENGKIILY